MIARSSHSRHGALCWKSARTTSFNISSGGCDGSISENVRKARLRLILARKIAAAALLVLVSPWGEMLEPFLSFEAQSLVLKLRLGAERVVGQQHRSRRKISFFFLIDPSIHSWTHMDGSISTNNKHALLHLIWAQSRFSRCPRKIAAAAILVLVSLFELSSPVSGFKAPLGHWGLSKKRFLDKDCFSHVPFHSPAWGLLVASFREGRPSVSCSK